MPGQYLAGREVTPEGCVYLEAICADVAVVRRNSGCYRRGGGGGRFGSGAGDGAGLGMGLGWGWGVFGLQCLAAFHGAALNGRVWAAFGAV
jgi:hypothetical protein